MKIDFKIEKINGVIGIGLFVGKSKGDKGIAILLGNRIFAFSLVKK